MSHVSSAPTSVGDSIAHVSPTLRVLGYGRLKPVAAAIDQAAARTRAPAATPAVGAAGAAAAAQRCAILLDPPALAVAWALQSGAAKGIGPAIAQWLEAAQECLRRWSQAPSLVALLDGSRADAGGLAAAVAQWDGHPIEIDSTVASPPPVDAALLHLAHRACAATPNVGGVLWSLADAALVFANAAPDLPTKGPAMEGKAGFAVPSRPQPVSELERVRRGLLHAQLELETVYGRLFAAADEVRARSVTSGRAVRAAHVRLAPLEGSGAALQFEAGDLQIEGSRRLPRLRAELHLVDGEPELRLYATGSVPEILHVWRSDGGSGGRSFMRLRPAGTEDRLRLQLLGAADWQMVVAIVTLLCREVERAGSEAPTVWHVLASRLRQQLGAIPARFRYDGLRVGSDGPSSDTLSLCFDGAAYGNLSLGEVRLRWSRSSLDWMLNEGATELPLTAWPIDPAGKPAPSWSIPVFGAARDLEPQWQGMEEVDRAVLLAVLDALPACANVASEELVARRGGREALAASAAALLRNVRRSLVAGQVKARLRRVRGLGWLMR